MNIETYLIIGLIILSIAVLFLTINLLSKISKQSDGADRIEQIKTDISAQQNALRQELTSSTQTSIKSLGEILSASQNNAYDLQNRQFSEIDKHTVAKQEAMQTAVVAQIGVLEKRFQTFSLENEQKLDSIRQTVSKSLAGIQEDNNKRLEEMRQTVNEKLQKTLDERMTESFKTVNDRLEQVYKGLGEMQTLATGVGDLKKVLSNVKTRGILGEIQLGAILKEILSIEQYDVNVVTKKGSRNNVEFAIKIPNEDGSTVYLPIDSKFPGDSYTALKDAYESGSSEEVSNTLKNLMNVLKSEAKDISEKYIDPPNTTDFAIMFLPFEGLYAEAINNGMIEQLQQKYKVCIAGPSTMAALLNTLQMGFRTFAIQKRSSEVWNVLNSVKTEFDKFSSTLEATQQRLSQANAELDKLVGVRTRQIQKQLSSFDKISEIPIPTEGQTDLE